MRKLALLVALAAAGAMLALVVARPASAWSIQDATANGFTVDQVANGSCTEVYITGHGASRTDLGSTCDGGFQAALDAFMGQWCPCAQAATTTVPTTDPATTAPTDTNPPPPPTTTAADPVQAQIADLQKQIDQIRGELVSLIQILERWPGIDPGILSQLLALQQT